MNYNIKGTELQVTPELREYVEKKLSHAQKFFHPDPTVLAEVELAHDALHDGGKYCAEFTLSLGGGVFRASEWGSTMHEAIDLGVAALTRELQRVKKKKLHVFRHSALMVKEYLRGWRRKV